MPNTNQTAKSGSRIYSRPNWAEVSLSALRHNFRLLQEHVGNGVTICSVVKCNAYGHGHAECAAALEEEGGRWFGVTSTDEGVALREAGIQGRILIMAGAWRGEEDDVLRYSLTPAVSRPEEVEAFALAATRLRVPRPVPLHLKVDTGMARLGLPMRELDAFADTVQRRAEIELEGVFSHLASSEVLDDPETRNQVARFKTVLRALSNRGVKPTLRHLANSCAVIQRPDAWHNFVRPGLALYGYELPSVHRDGSAVTTAPALPLLPVLSWKTRIILLRDVPAGQALGYGGTYVAPGAARIAVIAAGYGDGFSRKNSNPAPVSGSTPDALGPIAKGPALSRSKSHVLLRGERAPIVGRVSMDMTLIDVSHIPGAEIGDEVVLLGCSGGLEITAWDLARWAETLPYEVLCNLSERVSRKYIE